jgi:spermidine synthase
MRPQRMLGHVPALLHPKPSSILVVGFGAGVTLDTKDYFDRVKEHLNPGGIVTQWVPLYETDLDTVKTEIATFFDVFPDGTIWANEGNGGGYDIVLLGRAGAAKIQVDELQRRLDRPEYSRVAQSLRDAGFHSALELLATYAGQGPDLQPWLNDAEINRDGNLRLQYLGGLAVNANLQELMYDGMLRYRRFPGNLFTGSEQAVDAIRRQHAWQ